MKIVVVLVSMLLMYGCGEEQVVESQAAAAASVDICDCANATNMDGALAVACGALMESNSPEEIATKTMACRENLAVPESGPDLCFCVRTSTQDPDIQSQCMDLMEGFTPADINSTIQNCARQ